jgi:hypothetical protein
LLCEALRRKTQVYRQKRKLQVGLDFPARPVGGGDQRAQAAQQNQSFHMNGSLVETIEDLAAGIIGRNCIHITADGVASRIHAGDDGELRIGGEQHHHYDQNSLRNNAAVVSPCKHRDHEEDQSTEQSYPMQTHQGIADDHTGRVNARRRSSEERRQLAEGDRREYGAEENQRSQPKAKHQVHQGMEECAHVATWEPCQ